ESALDSEGETLLKNLHDLLQDDQIGKSLRNEVVGWTITHLAYPERSFAQVPHKGTCAATVVAMDQIEENPAELVRIIEGLAAKPRQVKLSNGEVLERGVGATAYASGTGSPVEKMIQASFMDFARPEQEYTLSEDSFSDDKADTGLWPAQVERLVEAVTGEPVELRKLEDWEFQQLLDRVDQTVPTTLQWGEQKDTKHMVLATGVDKDFVYYRNPWGERSDDDSLKDQGRERLQEGRERMPRRLFLERLDYAVQPEGWRGTPEKQPGLWQRFLDWW
ncbi:MAG: hypothetical protein KC910_37230, partial [Candidatus Eremiobacteraeota bacterium]|nr:hypothetical protein [Candidatus Eremiobacteraeota bacterium]